MKVKSTYKKIWIPESKTRQDEHRYLMEQHLGRKLGRFEFVHHINGVKDDNRIENLQVMMAGEHVKLHMEGKKLTPEHIKKFSDAQRGIPRPYAAKLTPEAVLDIRQMKQRGKTERYIAGLYKVSKTTVHEIVTGINWRYLLPKEQRGET